MPLRGPRPLWDTPVELVEIPFEEGVTFPAVLVSPGGNPGPRATIVHINGYDSNVHEMFVAHVGAGTVSIPPSWLR